MALCIASTKNPASVQSCTDTFGYKTVSSFLAHAILTTDETVKAMENGQQ
jgi:hypothetical protein